MPSWKVFLLILMPTSEEEIMNLKDRIIATKCENNADFAARYAFKQATGTKMKPLHAR